MGVNRCGFGIINDEAVQEASRQEIIRRFYRASCEYAMGIGTSETIDRIKLIMDELDLEVSRRTAVTIAHDERRSAIAQHKGKDGIVSSAALILHDGTAIAGTNSEILHASSALVLNAIKHLAGIPEVIDLIPKSIMNSIQLLKRDILTGRRISLDVDEVLIALAMSATSNPAAEAGLQQLKRLRGPMPILPTSPPTVMRQA